MSEYQDPSTLPELHVIDVAGHFGPQQAVSSDPSHEHRWEWQVKCSDCGAVGHLVTAPTHTARNHRHEPGMTCWCGEHPSRPTVADERGEGS